jgi:transcriptional activator of cad operon
VDPKSFRLGDFVVDPDGDRLIDPETGARVRVEPKTMAVLLALAARDGRVVSCDDLIRHVWDGRPMGENPVYKSIAKLRQALGDTADPPRYVETIPRKGYRLVISPGPLEHSEAPVRPVAAAAVAASVPAR